MSIGDRLRSLRKKLGLTQKEFASRIKGKVDYTYIGKIERGRQYPSIKMLERISQSFDVPLSYFFEEEKKQFEMLPQDIKSLLGDVAKQKLLRMSRWLDRRDLLLVLRIMDILIQSKKEGILEAAERREIYGEKMSRKDLILKIQQALSSPGVTLSTEEEWVREVLRIALERLEKE